MWVHVVHDAQQVFETTKAIVRFCRIFVRSFSCSLFLGLSMFRHVCGYGGVYHVMDSHSVPIDLCECECI
jgi:hypothetical protein